MKKITDKMRLDWVAMNGVDALKYQPWEVEDGFESAFRDAIDAAIRAEGNKP